MKDFNNVRSTVNSNSAMSNYGWTSEGLDCVFKTKKEAEERLIYAFGGECGDCGFKSKKEILDMYPVFKVKTEEPMDFTKDVEKCYTEYERVDDALKAVEEGKICSITGETYYGYGNNAYPFDGRCSDYANGRYVIPARLIGVNPESIKKFGKKAILNLIDYNIWK